MDLGIVTVLFSLWTQFFYSTRPVCGETLENVQRLMDDMFSSAVYNPQIRGQHDLSEITDVNISFVLRFIQKLDDQEESFEVLGLLSITWIDERLIWKPRDYNGTKKVWITMDKVWRPEIILENPLTSKLFLGDDISRMTAMHRFNGVAAWNIVDTLKSGCSVDLQAFPWDTQTCRFVFIVWGYFKNEVRLGPGQDTIDLSVYQTNGQWVLLSTEIYEDYHPLKSLLVFEFVLKRRPEFFVINILLPIVALSILNLVVFLVPVDSGERVSFSLTILLSIAVFLTLISDSLPPSAETIPAICYLLLCVLVQSIITCVCNIISIRTFYRDGIEPCSNFMCSGCLNRFLRKAARKKLTLKTDNKVSDLGDNCDISKSAERDEEINWKDISRFYDILFLILITFLLISGYAVFAILIVYSD